LRSRKAPRITQEDLKALNMAIVSLTRIENKLARRILNLENEEKKYINLCKEALRRHKLADAHAYASYVASIRASLRVCKAYAAYTLEMKVKLVCYREIILVWHDISPSLEELREAAKRLRSLLPWLTEDLREFQDMASSIIDSLNPEEILGSVKALEESLFSSSAEVFKQVKDAFLTEANIEEILPTPPGLTTPLAEGQAPAVQEPISISLSANGPQGMSQEDIDEMVLDYLRRSGGKLNIVDCAKELGLTISDVRSSLDRLASSGRIKLSKR